MISLFSKAINFGVLGLSRRFSYMDIGARGGIGWPWSCLPLELLSVVLVEPDPEEAEKLQKHMSKTGNGMVLSGALWSNNAELSLNINRWPATSSLYPANQQFLDQFPESDRFHPESKISIQAHAIDSLAANGGLPDIDFIKIDVQGAELPILEGGTKTLAAGLIGLEVEVEFAEMYLGQPLFSDVDRFVREKIGLELWDLQSVHWKYRSGIRVSGPNKGRLIFGDALYLRPLTNIQSWLDALPAQVAKEKAAMLVIAAIAYGYIDYASTVLQNATVARQLEPSVKMAFEKVITSTTSGFRPLRNGSRYVYWLLYSLAQAFRPTYNSWAYGGNGLGNRRRGPFWR
jgi:FkbM family methyltransferase